MYDAPPPPPAEVSEIVVKAARLGPAMSDQAFAVVQLPMDEVRDNQRVDQALSQSPGVSLFRRTDSILENPTTQGISLRSIAPSGAGRALVTLDGVPQNDPFGGWVIWAGLPPQLLDGVTIVRGGGAGPYGAGALTGVVALDERSRNGLAADVSYGSFNTSQAQFVGETDFAGGNYLISGSTAHSNGFIPVDEAHRGPADTPTWLNSYSTSLRANYNIADAVLSVRGSAFQEDRGSGQINAVARAKGQSGSVTLAREPEENHFGWRLQGWVRASNLYNTAVSVGAGRATAPLSNVEYDTPATGYGVNMAFRAKTATNELEIGVDYRRMSADENELFSSLLNNRKAGGNQSVGGAYVEDAHRFGQWLLTGGLRVDYWDSTNGHKVETVVATGATLGTSVAHYADTNGTVPTARLGLRRDLGDGYYVRAATYAGFRQPSLNELYRPFRVGNITTNANPALKPEKLYGGEAAFGRTVGMTDLAVTVFYNEVKDAVGNVTQSATVRQRQNIDAIQAPGVEAEAAFHLSDSFKTHLGASYTSAKVDGGAALPALTGLRPAQAPRFTLTGSAEWRPTDKFSLSATGRYESLRFDDDLNANKLPAGGTVDLRASYAVAKGTEVYVTAGNVFDEKLATAIAADGTISYDTPRTFGVGLSLRY